MKLQLDSIRERDIDLLFIRLLNTNCKIRKFVSSKLDLEDFALIESYHSIMNEHGESDIKLVYKKGKRKISVHIENKIDALPQDRQYERYVERCEKECKNSECDEYRICILCTKKYSTNDSEALKYPYKIIYEELLEAMKYAKCNNFDIQMLEGAIYKGTHYVYTMDENKTVFWKKFFDLIEKDYSSYGFKYNAKKTYSPRSLWRSFSTFTPKIRIVYKSERGYVDIEFENGKENEINIKTFLGWHGYMVLPMDAGKSLVYRQNIEKIDFNKTFDEQLSIVRKAIEIIHHSYLVVDKMRRDGINNVL